MRIIVLISLLAGLLSANAINDSLLKIHAAIVPKLLLMNRDFTSNGGQITIVIYSEDLDKNFAKSLKEKIELNYREGLRGNKVVGVISDYNQEPKYANIFYLFPTDAYKMKKITDYANKNKIMTFSFLEDDLKNNALLSIRIDTYTKPVLNLKALKNSRIDLRQALIDLSLKISHH